LGAFRLFLKTKLLNFKKAIKKSDVVKLRLAYPIASSTLLFGIGVFCFLKEKALYG